MEMRTFIKQINFPCIMARALAHHGYLHELALNNMNESKRVLDELYHFIDHYRAHPQTLHSFTLTLTDSCYQDFHFFEESFWHFLQTLKDEDKKNFNHDPRVSDDPMNPEFSYSLKEESFFILALHPQSPRWSRRFKCAAIVFNPHQQFEELRAQGKYTKIRDIIRQRDKIFQGDINPMLSDFGEESEIYQYMGRYYQAQEKQNFLQ